MNAQDIVTSSKDAANMERYFSPLATELREELITQKEMNKRGIDKRVQLTIQKIQGWHL